MKPADELMDTVEWVPLPAPQPSEIEPGLPYATHAGLLKIGDVELQCYQLSDGRRVIDAADVEKMFGGL